MRSDMGGVYYGKHMDFGQTPLSFFKFCKYHDIVNQYTMCSTSQHKHVLERRNIIIMDMVESMLTLTCLISVDHDIKIGCPHLELISFKVHIV